MEKRTWNIVAKDYNSPFARNYYWVWGMLQQAAWLDLPQIYIGISSFGDNIEYFADMKSWDDVHQVLKARVKEDPSYVDELIEKTNAYGKDMNAWSEQITNGDISAYMSRELHELLQEAWNKQAHMYAYGVALPILDFQGFSYVENSLEEILKKHTQNDEEYRTYYDAFTAPAHRSFAQDQDVALLELMVRHSDNTALKQDVLAKVTLKEMQEKHTAFWSDLEQHTNTYNWVYFVYAGPAFTEADFLAFVRIALEKNGPPADQLAELHAREARLKDLRETFVTDKEVTAEERAMLSLAGKMVWAKPRRKDYQSRTYYHVFLLQKEIAKRLHMTVQQVRSCTLDMLEAALDGKEVDRHLPNIMHQAHVCVPSSDSTVDVLVGDEATAFLDTIDRHEEEAVSNVSELYGTCANPGSGQGTVRVINTRADLDKMQTGDILVSVATTPAIVSAMKMASAIVTDEGGLTCHAAIVSRELNIPCVIGTKIATKVFQDGDTVTVDATKGIVTI